MCLLLCLNPPSGFKHPGLSWHGYVNSRLWRWGGGELLIYNSWPGFSPKLFGSLSLWCRAWSPSLWPTKSPYCTFLNVLCKLWLPNFVSAGLILAVRSVPSEDQLGVQVGCMRKWIQLLPTSPPSSAFPVFIFLVAITNGIFFPDFCFWYFIVDVQKYTLRFLNHQFKRTYASQCP